MAYLAPLLFFALLIITGYLLNARRNNPLPRVGLSPGPWSMMLWPARIYFAVYGYEMVQEAYKQYRDRNYSLQTTVTDVLVISPRFLSELRMLPEQKLNSAITLVEKTLGIHSGVDVILEDHQGSNITRVQLRNNLPSLVPAMVEELENCLSTSLRAATSTDFKPFNAFDLIFDTVMHVSSRVFVGLPFCRSQTWLEEIQAYQLNVALICICLLPFPEQLRPWITPMLPPCRRMKKIHRQIKEELFPPDGDANFIRNEQPTVIGFFIRTMKTVDHSKIVAKLLVLLSAALHTTTNSITQVMYDLCSRPEDIALLREEALQAYSKSNATWTFESLQSLKHLDSFMKESQRINAPSFLSFDRKVMSTIELSDGTQLKAGTTIAMPSECMAKDSTYYDSPLVFNSDRFYCSGNDAQDVKEPLFNDFINIEPGNLSWGSGRFTCPGRWYASVEMKLIIASFLVRYDFIFPQGQSKRPANWHIDDSTQPSRKQSILFRRRSM